MADLEHTDPDVIFKYSDSHQIMSKKIYIGKMSKQTMNMQIEYYNYVKQVQTIHIEVAKGKCSLLDDLESLYEKQMTEYTEIREQEIHSICRILNSYDEPSKSLIDLIEKIRDLETRICRNIEDMEKLMADIPETAELTNFTIKRKL